MELVRLDRSFRGGALLFMLRREGAVKLIDRPLPPCTCSRPLESMIPCRVMLLLVWEYLDGVVPSQTMRLIDSHLSCCPECHALYTFDQAFLRCLRRCASA